MKEIEIILSEDDMMGKIPDWISVESQPISLIPARNWAEPTWVPSSDLSSFAGMLEKTVEESKHKRVTHQKWEKNRNRNREARKARKRNRQNK